MTEAKHSPLPWRTHPQVPTAVVDLDGRKIASTARSHVSPEINHLTAAANAAVIVLATSLHHELVQALQFYCDAFQFHPKRSATGIDLSTWKPKPELLEDCGERARAALQKVKQP
jgi:hypothetical protein